MHAFLELNLFVSEFLASGSSDDDSGGWAFVFLLAGFVFYAVVYLSYRNKDKRHHHERETKSAVTDPQGQERFVAHRKGLANAEMKGSNEDDIRGARAGVKKNVITQTAGRFVASQPPGSPLGEAPATPPGEGGGTLT